MSPAVLVSGARMARAAELQVVRTHAKDDYENMGQQFPAYGALYAHCRAMVK